MYGCGGWDQQLYKFMCPVSGYYLFLISINSGGYGSTAGCPVYLWIAENQTSQRMLYSQFYNIYSSVQITAASNVILPCESGQTVWVETARVSSLSGNRYNQFTGYLLKQGLE